MGSNQMDFSFFNAWLNLKKLNFCNYFYSNLVRIINTTILKKTQIVLNLLTLQLIKSLIICAFSTEFNKYQNISHISLILMIFFYRFCSEIQLHLKFNKQKELLQKIKSQIQVSSIYNKNIIKAFYQSYISIILQCANRNLLCKFLLQSLQIHHSYIVILTMALVFTPKLIDYQFAVNQKQKKQKHNELLKQCQSQWTLWFQIVILLLFIFQFLGFQFYFLTLSLIDFVLIAHVIWLGTSIYLAFFYKNSINYKKLKLKKVSQITSEKWKFALYFLSFIYYPLEFYLVQRHALYRDQNSTQIQILMSLNVGIFLANSQHVRFLNDLIAKHKNKVQLIKNSIFNIFSIIYTIIFSITIVEFYYGDQIDQNTQTYFLYQKFIPIYFITIAYIAYRLFKIRRQIKKVLQI